MMHTNVSVSSWWTILSLVFILISFQSSKWIPSLTLSNFVVDASSLHDALYKLAFDANMYGFPLMTTRRSSNTTTVVNCTNHERSPSNVFAHTVIDPTVTPAPNMEVLYSPVRLDLSKGPVVIQHPDMGLRYFSFQLMDPYTNVVGYLGSRMTGREAARFAIKWKNDNTTGHTHLTNIKQTITVDYSRIIVLGRVLVNDLDSDLEAATNLQLQFKSIPPGGEIIVPKCPDGTEFDLYPMPGKLDFYAELNKALALFPPPSVDNPLLQKLEKLGIGGKFAYTDTPAKIFRDGRKRRALLAANAAFMPALELTIVAAREKKQLGNNGWTRPPKNVGNFSTDYLTRAVTAIVGFAANTLDESFYQSANYDDKGRSLRSSRTYQLVFEPDMEPEVNEYWSITLYKTDFSIPMNVGEPIYSIASKQSSFVRQANGAVVIHISQAKPYEATTIPKTVNWLPSPLSKENFYIMLRCYHPKQSVLDYTWKAPGIRQVKKKP